MRQVPINRDVAGDDEATLRGLGLIQVLRLRLRTRSPHSRSSSPATDAYGLNCVQRVLGITHFGGKLLLADFGALVRPKQQLFE